MHEVQDFADHVDALREATAGYPLRIRVTVEVGQTRDGALTNRQDHRGVAAGAVEVAVEVRVRLTVQEPATKDEKSVRPAQDKSAAPYGHQ